MAKVQAARQRAIETSRQVEYVLGCVPLRYDHTQLDRVLGCLIGGAVGDAFGYTIEFQRLADILQQYGRAGLQEPVFQGGRLVVSDDTQMTLFTAQALTGACDNGTLLNTEHIIHAVNMAYLEWLRTQRSPFSALQTQNSLLHYRELWAARAPGNTCLSALSAGGGGSPEQPMNNSKATPNNSRIGCDRGCTPARIGDSGAVG